LLDEIIDQHQMALANKSDVAALGPPVISRR
jgi:hypothetical protein